MDCDEEWRSPFLMGELYVYEPEVDRSSPRESVLLELVVISANVK